MILSLKIVLTHKEIRKFREEMLDQKFGVEGVSELIIFALIMELNELMLAILRTNWMSGEFII